MIANRLNARPIGFSNAGNPEEEVQKDELLSFITSTDLRSFGLIPELIGRLPVISYLNPLDAEALKRILTEPRNALVKQYQKLFKMEGVDLEFTESGLDFIVEKAIEFQLGARGLRSICETILTDSMFDIPTQADAFNLTVDKAFAEARINKSKFSKRMMAA